MTHAEQCVAAIVFGLSETSQRSCRPGRSRRSAASSCRIGTLISSSETARYCVGNLDRRQMKGLEEFLVGAGMDVLRVTVGIEGVDGQHASQAVRPAVPVNQPAEVLEDEAVVLLRKTE